jgi:hypothetical protein
MGSFLDKLLAGAVGRYNLAPPSGLLVGPASLVATAGQLVTCDPTSASPSVTAPQTPAPGAYFGVADATAKAGTHAINLIGGGTGQNLEVPGTPGTYSNTPTITVNSQVNWWCFIPGVGWKLVYQFKAA